MPLPETCLRLREMPLQSEIYAYTHKLRYDFTVWEKCLYSMRGMPFHNLRDMLVHNLKAGSLQSERPLQTERYACTESERHAFVVWYMPLPRDNGCTEPERHTFSESERYACTIFWVYFRISFWNLLLLTQWGLWWLGV